MILGQNFKFLLSLCMLTLDLEMKVGDVFKGWEGHPDHIWRFQMMMAAILDFFPRG